MTPLLLGISDNLPWGGYGFFLELHNHFLGLAQSVSA